MGRGNGKVDQDHLLSQRKRHEHVPDTSRSELIRVDELDPFVTGYIEAALWTSEDEIGELSIYDFSQEALAKIVSDCKGFVSRNTAALDSYMTQTGRSMSDAGHDLWLTRYGHGTGFWDRKIINDPSLIVIGGDALDLLTQTAVNMGQSSIYISDDGGLEVT